MAISFNDLINGGKIAAGIYTGEPSLALSGASGLAGSSGAGSASRDAQARIDQGAQQAIGRIEQGLNEYDALTGDSLATVLDSLSAGESEASDEIMAGLGMSIEERTKFFDIAKDNIDWVVDFGKARQGQYNESMKSSEDVLGQSQQFIDHYKELVFNPDAIYDTEVYNSIKDRTVQEWGNFYSGKGLLSGNAQEGMVDRMSELAYGFLGGERNAALQGVNAVRSISDGYLNQAAANQQAIGLGANASGQISNLAFQTGDSNANDIMSAYGSLAGITQAFNPATFQYNSGQTQAETIANARTSQANAELASGLGQGTISGDIASSRITAGTAAGIDLADILANTGKTTAGTESAGTISQSGFGVPKNPWNTDPDSNLYNTPKKGGIYDYRYGK